MFRCYANEMMKNLSDSEYLKIVDWVQGLLDGSETEVHDLIVNHGEEIEEILLAGRVRENMGKSRSKRKIDLFCMGDYVVTTEASKTCKEARLLYLRRLEERSHSLGGLGTLEAFILRNPKTLTARFQKCRTS